MRGPGGATSLQGLSRACLLSITHPPDIVRSLQNRCSLKFWFLVKALYACNILLVSYSQIQKTWIKIFYLRVFCHLNCCLSRSQFPQHTIGDFKFSQAPWQHSNLRLQVLGLHKSSLENGPSKLFPIGWLIPSHLPTRSFVTNTHLLNSPISLLSTGLRCYAHSNIFGIRSPHSPSNGSRS